MQESTSPSHSNIACHWLMAENRPMAIGLIITLAEGRPLDGEPLPAAHVQITLVDGKTGDVLLTTANYFSGFDKNKPSKAIQNLFSRYPKQKSKGTTQ